MYTIRELSPKLVKYLKTHNLEKDYKKAKLLFEKDIRHKSLNVELLEPKKYGIYSFRINIKYRALFFFVGSEVEVFDINNHYS